MYAVQGYCPQCDKGRVPYGGRFFALPCTSQFDSATHEWDERKDSDFAGQWPTSELPYGFMTHMNNGGIPNHGYTHWWTMFNSRQLLVLVQLVHAIRTRQGQEEAEVAIGTLPQLLRYHCMFSIWQAAYDKMIPHFSNNNYYPKANMVEGSLFGSVGAGTFDTFREWIDAGITWMRSPWELVSNDDLSDSVPALNGALKGKSEKTFPQDPVLNGGVLECRSSSDLKNCENESLDLVITDPPFGGLLHYSELADYFYVWLRLCLKDKYPSTFSPEYTPKILEAVANRARHSEDSDAFYQKILTECWREAFRILKPGGILAFTFHHSEDEPWVAVLESLFQSGFYLEAAYPIRSDETKGEGSKPGTFGSQQIEFDIVHVCRKRLEEPEPISWARIRRAYHSHTIETDSERRQPFV